MSHDGPDGGVGTPPDSGAVTRDDPDPSVRVFQYDLTLADVLAWEKLPSEIRGWRKLGFFAPWFAIGMTLGALEDIRSRTVRYGVAGAVGLAVMAVVMVLNARARRRRARARLPRPCRMQCADAGDHLSLQSLDPPGPAAFVAPEMIRQIVQARGHLFIEAPPTLIILPASAFKDRDDMTAFAAAWQDRLDALDALDEARAV